MGCSIIGNGQQSPHLVEGKPSGLKQNHSYSIDDLMEFRDKNNQVVRVMRLRNPWGKSEWLEAWSNESDEVRDYMPQIEKYIASLHQEEQFDITADDGTFLMSYDDWSENFHNLFINIDFPEDWTGVRFMSAWTKSNSGGIPHRADPTLFE
jgi:calpain